MERPGTNYLKSSDRFGNVLWEVVICDACLKQHEAVPMRRGDKRVIRPWGGEPRPCSFCDDSENAPEFKL